MPGGELLQFNVTDSGNGVCLDDELVAVSGGSLYIGLGIELIPGPRPGSHGVFVCLSADVQSLAFCHGGLWLFPDLRLCSAQHILVDALTSLGVVSGSVPSLPAAVASLSNTAFSVGTFFSYVCLPLFQSRLAGNHEFHTAGFYLMWSLSFISWGSI